MVPRILITGSTGYIGGSVLAGITVAHPEYQITAVLRKVSQRYVDAYPHVKTIVGDYDSAELLAKVAADNDIVIHAGDSDHKGAMEALLAGLGRRTTPSFLIHLSGTACISDVYDGIYGALNHRVWSDVDDIDEILHLPEDRVHTHVDRLVWAAPETHGAHIHTAIMCPPDIYGKGHGPGITQSFLPPFTYDAIVNKKAAFYLGTGENVRSFVHIDDVMSLYVHVVEEAATSLETGIVRRECWDKNGFYFNSSEEVAWKDIAAVAGKAMEINLLFNFKGFPLGPYMFGSNSRSRADRGSKVFRWKPAAPSTLLDVLEDDLLAHHLNKERKVPITQ
ncbi:nucleoside-diphosphate-sugar epimerase [Mycena rebaudengoi]|nr:nucleoside-diphosphate-sugar epimerase [Mycena rebaudengoi]